MSHKLNAEGLAAKIERLSSNIEGNVAKWVNEDLMDIAQHIREVAQPIADERDELREVLEEVIASWQDGDFDTASASHVRAILKKYPKP
jgi:hypothetical protein